MRNPFEMTFQTMTAASVAAEPVTDSTSQSEGNMRGIIAQHGETSPLATVRNVRLRPGSVLPVTGGGPHDHGWAGSPGPARTMLPVFLGRQIIGVGFDEQLYEHRVHDVPLGSAAASVVGGPLLLGPGIWAVCYGPLCRE